MNDLITLFAFGTFGNPNGFTHSIFLGNPNLKNSLRTFDLNTNAIKLFEGDKLYSIRKENISDTTYISYSVYQYAKEPNSNREGAFIGLSIISINSFINENLIINVLNDEIENLYKNNVTEGIINILSSDQFIVNTIKDFDKIESNVYDFNLNLNSNPSQSLFIYTPTDQNNLSELLKKSTRLLNSYDTIYFSQNIDIAEEVNRKGLFELIQKKDFEQKINQIIEFENQKILETKTKILNTINDLKEEANKILKQKQNSYQTKLEVHQKNGILIKDDEKELKSLKENFETKIKLINEKFQKSDYDQLDEIEIIIQGLKNEFSNYNTISRSSIETFKKNTNDRKLENHYNTPHFEDYKPKNVKPKNDISLPTIVSFVLFLGIIILSYFTYDFYLDLEIKNSKIEELNNTINIEDEVSEIHNLNPYPNNQLNDKDVKLVDKKLEGKEEIKIDDVVNTIIEINPNSIGKYYSFQRKDYTLKLYELNENSFQINDKKDTIFMKAISLKNIPCIQ